MNTHQTAQFLLSWSKLERKEYLKDPKQCEVYLKRLQFFLDLIGNPEKKIPRYIHVTGTSGKGSVCLMLDSILRADGRRVGTMTSPHADLTQTRWQVNGKIMSDSEFAKILTELKPKLAKYLKTSPYDPISHFELMTAIGLYWFAEHKADWAILEVGCGGRYDSTNVISRKDIAVITNVGLDHMDILGKTKAKIAHEKCGIIKPGCKVFTMEKNKKILAIIKNESKKKPKSYILCPKSKDIRHMTSDIRHIEFEYKNNTYTLSCLGNHQINNAILAIEIAKSLKVPYSTIKRSLEKVKLPLRLEIVSENPLIILDGAHNPDKMRTTVATVRKLVSMQVNKYNKKNTLIPPQQDPAWCGTHLLIGFSADKNIKTMCRQLATLQPVSIAITKFHSHFKKPAEPTAICQIIKRLIPNAKTKIFSNPKQAFNWSKKQNKKKDILLVTGSMYLAGEISLFFDLHLP